MIYLKTLLNLPGIIVFLILLPILIYLDNIFLDNKIKFKFKIVLIILIKCFKPTLIVYSKENVKWTLVWLYHILLVKQGMNIILY